MANIPNLRTTIDHAGLKCPACGFEFILSAWETTCEGTVKAKHYRCGHCGADFQNPTDDASPTELRQQRIARMMEKINNGEPI